MSEPCLAWQAHDIGCFFACAWQAQCFVHVAKALASVGRMRGAVRSIWWAWPMFWQARNARVVGPSSFFKRPCWDHYLVWQLRTPHLHCFVAGENILQTMLKSVGVAHCMGAAPSNVGLLSLWHAVRFDILCAPFSSRHGAHFDIVAQPSRHFVRVEWPCCGALLILCSSRLSLWRGAHFDIAHATFSSVCACHIALVAPRWWFFPGDLVQRSPNSDLAKRCGIETLDRIL